MHSAEAAAAASARLHTLLTLLEVTFALYRGPAPHFSLADPKLTFQCDACAAALSVRTLDLVTSDLPLRGHDDDMLV